MPPLNSADWIIIAFLLLFFLNGIRKGLVKILIGPLALIIATIFSYFYYIKTKQIVPSLLIGLLGPFILEIMFHLLLKFWQKAVSAPQSISIPSRVGGGAISLIWGAALSALTVVLIMVLPKELPYLKSFQSQINNSWIYNSVSRWQKKSHPKLQIPSFDQQMAALADPKKTETLQSSPEFMALINDPDMQKIFQDEETVKQIQSKDFTKLLTNPKVLELMQNEELLKKMMGLQQKMLQDSPAIPEHPTPPSAPRY